MLKEGTMEARLERLSLPQLQARLQVPGDGSMGIAGAKRTLRLSPN